MLGASQGGRNSSLEYLKNWREIRHMGHILWATFWVIISDS